MAKKLIKPVPRDHDTLLIVGGAPCVWDDLESWWELEHPHDVCIINDVGELFPCDFKHAFSYHAQLLVDHKYKNTTHHSINNKRPSGIDYTWRMRDTGGSSSFMAVQCALAYWGYSKVVCVGIPIDNTGHAPGLPPTGDENRFAETFLRPWIRRHEEFKDSLRSMSGNTREIYGPPTEEWLNNVNDC